MLLITAAHARDQVAAALGGYLCGSIPLGLLVTRALRGGQDIRRFGTGAVGTSNVYRNAGFWTAALVGPLQFAQGLLPVLVVAHWGGYGMREVAAVAAVTGNCWSVWLNLRGGRGVAVATGAVAGLSLQLLGLLLACYVVGLALRHIAAGVLAGFVLLPVAALFTSVHGLSGCALAILLVIVLRRLEGAREELGSGEQLWAVLQRRMLDDARAGQRLVGPRA